MISNDKIHWTLFNNSVQWIIRLVVFGYKIVRETLIYVK